MATDKPQKKNPAAVSLGRRGGKARLEKMTEEERKEVARKAAAARWGKKKEQVPKAAAKKRAGK